MVKSDLTTSKEASRFFKKNHTPRVKDDRQTPVSEVVDFRIQDVKTAQSPARPDTFLQEYVYAPKARKHVEFTCNGDISPLCIVSFDCNAWSP